MNASTLLTVRAGMRDGKRAREGIGRERERQRERERGVVARVVRDIAIVWREG